MTCAFRLRAAIAAIVLSAFAPAFASEAPAASEQITVLATRTATPVDIAPASVEIIEQSTIEARQSGVPADLLRGAPGFSVSQSGGIGSITEVRFRGAEANHLLVMVDGVAINDPALGSSVDFANLDLIGVTRVEILPGAQSALWGSDALAGVMNFETTPAPGASMHNVWLEGGSNDTSRASIQLAQRNDDWYYALNARHTETAGTNIAEQGGEDDGYRNTTLHLNTGYTGERGSFGVRRATSHGAKRVRPDTVSGFRAGGRQSRTRTSANGCSVSPRSLDAPPGLDQSRCGQALRIAQRQSD